MMERIGRRIFLRIVMIAVVVMVVGMSVLGVRSIMLLSSKVGPELEANAAVIGERVRSRIESAVELGIPLEGLVGVENYLESARASGPGVAALALRAADGRLLHAVAADPERVRAEDDDDDGRLVTELVEAVVEWADRIIRNEEAAPGSLILPIQTDGAQIATLEVEIDRLYVARQLRETALDIAVLAGVAILLAVEMLILVTSRTLRGPLSQFGRIVGRLREKDFTATAAPAGSRLTAGLIEAANELSRRVDAAARLLRSRIEQYASATEAGQRRVSQAALQAAERELARVGRFAGAGTTRIAATQLIGVRGAAFLFVLAEELTRPFMPLFIRTVTQEIDGADRALLIAIPISAFMLGLAVAGPLAATFSDCVGRRRSFMLGALLSTLGLFWMAYAGSFGELVLSRALSGFGYALTFVACQGHVIDRTDARTRTMGMSVFVGGIMAADICGPAIGGILADQIGYRLTLITAAGVALFAAVAALILLDDEHRREGGAEWGVGLRLTGECLSNPRFLAVVLLAAIPAKLILTGFLFFLVPLLMVEIGATEAEIGRMTMIYGISALALMPIFGGLCDRLQAHGFMVGLGALLTGWALVPLVFGPSIGAIALAVAALGVGQAMSIPAQTVMVTLIAQRQIDAHGPGPVLGVYRLAERSGSVLGPLIAAQAVGAFGLAQTGAMFGFLAISLGTLFSALFLTIGTLPSQDDRVQT